MKVSGKKKRPRQETGEEKEDQDNENPVQSIHLFIEQIFTELFQYGRCTCWVFLETA